MMRIAWAILFTAALAAGLVQIRARQTAVRAEMFRLEVQRMKVRRELWDQQLRLGEPLLDQGNGEENRPRWALDLVAPAELPRPSRRTGLGN